MKSTVKNESLLVRPDLQYRWVTVSAAGEQEIDVNVSASSGVQDRPSCVLFPWNAELFCQSLRGRNILIVGDSMNQHWRGALLYLD